MIVAVLGDTPATAVNVRSAGFPLCVMVSVFAASPSVAVAVIVAIGTPSLPPAVAGAVIAGFWFTSVIVSPVVVDAVPPTPSLTDQVIVWLPASLNPGVPLIVAVRGEPPGAWVKVRSAGIPVCVIVSVFEASPSVAVAVIVAMGVPSTPLAVAGAVIAGVWFVSVIVRIVVVDAVPPAPSLTDQVIV